MTSRHQMIIVSSTPKKPMANTPGPRRPNRPAPLPIERIQMIRPTAMQKATIEPTTRPRTRIDEVVVVVLGVCIGHLAAP